MSQSTTVSFPVLAILGIVFITLKLTSVINWSWWWVLAPFWGPLAAWALLVAVLFLGAILTKP